VDFEYHVALYTTELLQHKAFDVIKQLLWEYPSSMFVPLHDTLDSQSTQAIQAYDLMLDDTMFGMLSTLLLFLSWA
jgi:hypothetical protein